SYKFHFPTLQSSVLTAEEHTNISLRFGLVSECGVPEDFKITVAKILQENSFKVVVCNIARSTIAAEEDDEETEQDFSSSGLGTGVIVLGSVGIVVLGATAIAAIIVCARRGTRNNEVAEQEQPDVRHEPSPNLERQNDIQARPPAPSMHIYWEIPDVPDRIEEESPEASGIQADNYLIPDPPAAGVVK
ncbi:hypothetical protein BaRGS_00039191, partial [Batillaria attramentaria]